MVPTSRDFDFNSWHSCDFVRDMQDGHPNADIVSVYGIEPATDSAAKTGKSTKDTASGSCIAQVAAAATAECCICSPPRVDPAPPPLVTEPYRPIVHASYGEEDPEIVELKR